MNIVILVGRLTKDPEVRYTPSQMAVAKFTVATNRPKSDNADAPSADFIDVVAFGKTAELIERFFAKGKWIGVQGRMQNNNRTDKNGVKHYTYNVVADRIDFVGSKSDSETARPQTQQAPQESFDGFAYLPDDDGVPF